MPGPRPYGSGVLPCSLLWVCAQTDHSNDKDCPRCAQKQPAKCSNCKGDHPAWAGQCPVQKAAAQAREAYLTRPTHFAEDHPFPSLSPQIGGPQIATKRKAPVTPGDDPPSRGPWPPPSPRLSGPIPTGSPLLLCPTTFPTTYPHQ